MRIGTVVFLSATVIFCFGASIGRTEGAPQSIASHIDKGRLTMTDATLIRFTDGRIEGQSVTFLRDKGSSSETLGLDKVLRIDRQRGTHGGAFSASLGLGCMLGAILQINTQARGLEIDSETKTVFVAVVTGVGALVGYLIGSGQKRYATEYENPILKRVGALPDGTRTAPQGLCLLSGHVNF